jgi:hypothetical protein
MVSPAVGGRNDMHRRITITADPHRDLSRYEHENSLWPASWVGPTSTDPGASTVLVSGGF